MLDVIIWHISGDSFLRSNLNIFQRMHKALRTTDIVEIIFRHLDAESLADCSLTCKSWNQIIVDASLWRKLALRLQETSKQNCFILTLKGVNQTFDDLLEENNHFRRLCLRLNNFKKNWLTLEPVETFLKCSPAEVHKCAVSPTDCLHASITAG